MILSKRLFCCIYKWHTVIVAPDNSKISVFNKGTSQGEKSNLSMLIGGHSNPNSAVGEIEEWKYAQKKATKNITSEKINNPMDIIKLIWTTEVCRPSKDASLITSLNQKKSVTNANVNIITASHKPKTKPCMKLTAPKGTTKIKQDKIIGQGLEVTICQKWCVFKKKLFLFMMLFYY